MTLTHPRHRIGSFGWPTQANRFNWMMSAAFDHSSAVKQPSTRACWRTIDTRPTRRKRRLGTQREQRDAQASALRKTSPKLSVIFLPPPPRPHRSHRQRRLRRRRRRRRRAKALAEQYGLLLSRTAREGAVPSTLLLGHVGYVCPQPCATFVGQYTGNS